MSLLFRMQMRVNGLFDIKHKGSSYLSETSLSCPDLKSDGSD